MLLEFVFACGAVSLANLVRGVTGFGGSLVAIPLLTMIVGPVEAVALVVMVQLVGSIGIVPTVLDKARWSLIVATAGPLLVTQTVASAFLVSAPRSLLQLLFGVLVACFAVSMVIWPVRVGQGGLEELPERPARVLLGAAAFGLLGGTMAGLIGAAGPPIVYYYRRLFSDLFFRAQLICVFSIASSSLSLTLFARGVIGWELIVQAATLVPAMLAGLILGSLLAPRLPRAAFGRAVGVTLLLAGLVLGVKGGLGLVQPSSTPSAASAGAQ